MRAIFIFKHKILIMENIQTVFNRIRESKKEQKSIKTMYREALENSEEYQKTVEDLNILKEKKIQIESAIKSDFSSEFTKLENIKVDIITDLELLSDIALNHLVKGETISVQDEKKNSYEPVFSVKFKKIGPVAEEEEKKS